MAIQIYGYFRFSYPVEEQFNYIYIFLLQSKALYLVKKCSRYQVFLSVEGPALTLLTLRTAF
jgi:hypothetical protein